MALSVGIQLFSVRRDADADLYGTLKQLKEMGYQGIEFDSLHGHTPEEVRKMLDELGLSAVSFHIPLKEMKADIGRQIEICRILGNHYMAVPYMQAAEREGDAFLQVVKDIEGYAKAVTDAGMTMVYHNHDFEFEKIGDEYKLDYIYRTISPEILKTELDTCWIRVSGEDPAAYINRYADRAPLVHLKDFVGRKNEFMYELVGSSDAVAKDLGIFELRPVGYGCQDFYRILRACDQAVTEWIIVEQDEPSMGRTALESAALSRGYLKTLGY